MQAQLNIVADLEVQFELMQIDSDQIFAFFRHDFCPVPPITVYSPSDVFPVKTKSLTVRTVS
jgi:hypothetical protein